MNDLVVLDALLLFACASMYFGTGWSLVLFSFPGRASLTRANYHDQLMGPGHRATRFFTWMTVVMLGLAVVLAIAEWGEWTIVFPLLALAGVVAATLLTTRFIFAYNKALDEGVESEQELQEVLGRWMRLNVIRTLLWTFQWLAVAAWFFFQLR
jgi:hypothetical protein